MDNITSSLEGRPLGHHERLMKVLENIEYSLYISINVIQSKNQIGIQQVRDAFQQTSQMNFLMHACVKSDTSNTPWFRPISDRELLETGDWMRIDEISMDDEEGWERQIPKLVEEKFDYEIGPLWRVVWATVENCKENKYILYFICSHVIIDGISGFNLICNQIIPLLNGEKPECKPTYFGKAKEEIFYELNEEEMKPLNRPTPYFYRLLGNFLSWKSYLSQSIWGEPEPCAIHHYYEKFVIKQKASQSFIKICKSRGKSVHSVMMVLYYNSIEKTNAKFQIQAPSKVYYPTDLTKFESVFKDPYTKPLGLYINIGLHYMRHSILSGEKDIFEAASEVMENCQQFNCPKPNSTESDLMFVLMDQGLLTPSLADTFPPSLLFSNLGVCDSLNRFDKDGSQDVVLKNHFFTVESRGFFVGLCTFQNKFHVTVTYGSKKAEPECASYFAEILKENILNFVDLYLE